jgi:non-specific protein-tyrosine kinase
VVEPPQIPTTPIRPRVLINTLLAAIVGAMLALGIVFLIEYLDDRIKTPQDLYNVIDIPLLGTIARIASKRTKVQKNENLAQLDQSLITVLEPRHPTTEAYRSLRTNLQFSSIDSQLDSLLITSASPGEGKTTTAANLAIVIAQSGRSVILIDADMRKPRQHHFFSLSQSPGLTEALIASDVAPSNYVRATPVPNLSVLTSGKIPPNPAELLGSHRMQQLIEQLHTQADLIIFDAPPVLAVTDAQVLASQVKGVLLVIDSEQTRRAGLARATEALLRAKARLLGAVLNRLVRSPRGYYYYDAYSNYYSDKVEVLDEADAKVGKQVQAQERAQPNSVKLLDKDPLVQPVSNGVYKIHQEKSDT